jgi:hypothetical protein
VGILPDMRSPDRHAGIDLSPELLQIIVRHGTALDLLPPIPFREGRVKVEGFREARESYLDPTKPQLRYFLMVRYFPLMDTHIKSQIDGKSQIDRKG